MTEPAGSAAETTRAAASDPAGPDVVIAVDGLTKRYGELVAVDAVSFEVARGEVFGILGPNGAGKTTLVEMIEGLTEPSDGTARVLGHDLLTETARIKERIGVQLQASSYHRYLTLREILELFGSFYPKAADPDRLLERVGLGDRAGTRIRTLSGGMEQRFSIVAALVNEPEVVFFDEPTAGLDPDARRGLWSLIEEVRTGGATVVLTTHYIDEAERLCDRVAILNAGRIVAIDTPQALIRTLNAPYHIRITTDRELDAGALAAIDGTSDCRTTRTADGVRTELRARQAPSTMAALTALVERSGAELVDLAVQPATLEDVFLSMTGHSFSEGSADPDDSAAADVGSDEADGQRGA